jgi:Uma2 family endonuclease
MSTGPGVWGREWPVDERLVAPESRYEIVDGKVVYVAPADEPHGTRHSKISALVELHAAESYEVASDMLTRTSEFDDMAPDVSVFPAARDAATGRRQLEELAFEVVSTERLNDAARKAAKLANRGVRRVFAIDVERQRALEWSPAVGTWRILDDSATIEDAALAVPLPIDALVHAAKADDAAAHALLAKHNPVLRQALANERTEGIAEGRAEATRALLVRLITSRFGRLGRAEQERIARADVDMLSRWFDRVATAASIAEVFEMG